MPVNDKIKSRIISEVARCKGVWSFWSQNDYLSGKTFGSGGVCAPLCIVFLKLQATNEGKFNTYVTSPNGRDMVMQLKLQQTKKASKYDEEYLKAFGLKKAFSKYGCSDIEILNNIRIKGYYLIGISSLEGNFTDLDAVNKQKFEGHALAIVNDPNKIMFFDPNYGVGAFTNADDMATFINRFWKHAYTNMRGLPNIDRYFK